MTNINLNLPQEFRHVDYLDNLVLEIAEFKEKFAPYLKEININVEINLPPFSDDYVDNIAKKDGVYEVNISFRRHWINPGQLTSLPSPSNLYKSVKTKLKELLAEFEKDKTDKDSEINSKDVENE